MELMGNITQTLMKTILSDGLKCNKHVVDSILQGTMDPAQSLDTFGFTSLMEVFRYNCADRRNKSNCEEDENRYRIPCGDHRDVSLLTIIPKCVGTPGLEVFNWKGYWQAVEAASTDLDCVVFAGELLHRLTAGAVSPTSHRVVVQLKNCADSARYSCTFELLLNPRFEIDCKQLFNSYSTTEFKCIETSQDYISNTSKHLISVNK